MLCNKIIHVYSPSWDTNLQAQRINELTKVVNNILTLAITNKLKTVALPSISSGGYKYIFICMASSEAMRTQDDHILSVIDFKRQSIICICD
jgi:O-acetyl-ADP-ribose deacetylase (regulator of RNase III)